MLKLINMRNSFFLRRSELSNLIRKVVFYGLICFLINGLLLSSQIFAKDTASILKKMDAVGKYKTAKMTATMQIINKKGEKTSMSLISYERKKGEKTLMRFTAPARLKGTAILSVGDNIWYYNNRTNRVRLLSKSAKKSRMMGSSFSYEDISANYSKNFTAEILKETKKKYKLKLIPKDKGKSYKYILASVNKSNYVAEKMEYYNHKDLLYKVLRSEKVKKIKGHLVPLVMTMKEIGNQKVTNFEIDEDKVEFDLKLKKKLFSERYLKR
ncbi:outer membrane lipoprotein-sorting protein [Candidatus Margulisiibacteriota bacterium]